MNIDHSNSHSSFKDKVNMSNLCQEITLPTDPIEHIDGEGEIALCILSAVNVGIAKEDEMENLCDLARGLEELIDYQNYPVEVQKGQHLHVGHWVLDTLDSHTSSQRTNSSTVMKVHGL